MCAGLAILITHPAWQRRGAGAALVQWGLERARVLRLPAYVEATQAGLPLYVRSGFHVVGELYVPRERWGGAADRRYKVLVCDGHLERPEHEVLPN
jgi:GNAT superfamily N-acetyltransferase